MIDIWLVIVQLVLIAFDRQMILMTISGCLSLWFSEVVQYMMSLWWVNEAPGWIFAVIFVLIFRVMITGDALGRLTWKEKRAQWAEIPCTPCNLKFLDKGMKLYEIRSNYSHISEHIWLTVMSVLIIKIDCIQECIWNKVQFQLSFAYEYSLTY